MSFFGGMSKGERNRIKIRVRTAMATQTQLEGRFLGGRSPYGYALIDLGPHPNPAKAADGRRLHGLGVDPTTATVVERIFAEFLAGAGLYAIAEGLTRDGIPSPSANDPTAIATAPVAPGPRERSAPSSPTPATPATRSGTASETTRSSSTSTTSDTQAYESRQRLNPEHAWVTSTAPSHEAIISTEIFDLVQDQLALAMRTSKPRMPRATPRTYQLRGLLFCGLCQRRMQGNHNHDQNYYRCRYPNEYALANHVEHPRTVYLRENQILPGLDAWLATIFEPDHIETTLDQLATAQPDPAESPAAQAAAWPSATPS